MVRDMLSLNYYRNPKNFEEDDKIFFESNRSGFYQYQEYIESEFKKFKEQYYDSSTKQIVGIRLNQKYLEEHLDAIFDNKKFVPFMLCYYLVINYPPSRDYVPSIQEKWGNTIGSLYDAATKYIKLKLSREEKKRMNIVVMFDVKKFIEWYPEYSELLEYL